MDLKRILNILDKLAPLKLAAKWDNVGLLVEPSAPHSVRNILLTNDLTEKVLKEAIAWNADMIISYHPPIFYPLKKLTCKTWKERLVVKAVEHKIAIYSPHTACDAVQNGVNDWLSLGLGLLTKSGPIEHSDEIVLHKLLKLNLDKDDNKACMLLEKLQNKFSTTVKERNGNFEVDVVIASPNIQDALLLIPVQYQHDTKIIDLCPKPLAHTGMGRICQLQNPTSLADLIEKIKLHLSLSHLRLAVGDGWNMNDNVKSVALCAGSGGSVLKGVTADVFLTGEMSHHEVLDAVSNKTSVILCEHSNTERGFLSEYRNTLLKEFDLESIQVKVSEVDKDPLMIC